MKNIILIAILSLSLLQANAQEKNNSGSKMRFTSIVQFGILEGAADKSYAQLQLVNGIQKNAMFYGLGAAIDYYGPKRSLPLFFDVKRDLLKGKKKPFIYADAGYNFSWLRDKDKILFFGSDYKTKGGLFYEAGLGYKFILKNKMAFGFTGGYSLKEQQETFIRETFINFYRPESLNYQQSPDIYKYKFRRISLKFNWWF